LVIWDQHRLDRLAVAGLQPQLAGPVARAQHRVDRELLEAGPLAQQLAVAPGQVGHRVEVARAALVNPREHLIGPVARRAQLAPQPLAQLGARRPTQVRLLAAGDAAGRAADLPDLAHGREATAT